MITLVDRGHVLSSEVPPPSLPIGPRAASSRGSTRRGNTGERPTRESHFCQIHIDAIAGTVRRRRLLSLCPFARPTPRTMLLLVLSHGDVVLAGAAGCFCRLASRTMPSFCGGTASLRLIGLLLSSVACGLGPFVFARLVYGNYRRRSGSRGKLDSCHAFCNKEILPLGGVVAEASLSKDARRRYGRVWVCR